MTDSTSANASAPIQKATPTGWQQSNSAPLHRPRLAHSDIQQDAAMFQHLLGDLSVSILPVQASTPLAGQVADVSSSPSPALEKSTFAQLIAQQVHAVLPQQGQAFTQQLRRQTTALGQQQGINATLVLPALGNVHVHASGSQITLRAERKQTLEKLSAAKQSLADALTSLRNQPTQVDVL